MTVLIKGGDRDGLLLVRPIGTTPDPVPPAIPAATAPPEEDRVAALETALMEARGNLAALRQQHAADSEKIRAEAHARGVAEGVQRNAALAETLDKAMARAEAAMAEALGETSDLSLVIARSALRQVFADHGVWQAMVADIIAVRRAQIDDNLLLRIRVSASDFSDGPALAAIRPDDARATLIADPKLASGECRFDLHLGEIEIGPATQGRNLLAFIDRQLADGSEP